MARDFIINGETMVSVMGGAHMSGTISSGSQLGLTSDQIRVSPKFYHKDMRTDDFGPHCPAEVQWLLAEVNISMTLVHYDNTILSACVNESMGGTTAFGVMAPAGKIVGGNRPVTSSGCHFMRLHLASPQADLPWRFLSTYLAEPPFKIPLGTEKSLVSLNWRAIPYRGYTSMILVDEDNPEAGFEEVINTEIVSSGVVLWDRQDIGD